MKGQITSVSARNLRRDRRVLGKKWAKTYRGYFGSKKTSEYLSRQPLNTFQKEKKFPFSIFVQRLGRWAKNWLECLNAKTETQI